MAARLAPPARAPGETGVGLDVAPFPGLRFSPDRVDLAAVTSPPYDVLSPEAVQQLEILEPHNVVRLILPRAEDCGPEGRFQHAAATLRRWRSDGTLVAERAPALYVYEQRYRERRQRGVIGSVSLHPPDDGVILPHEDVTAGPVQDRLELMAATNANLEPILLVHDGDDKSGAAVEDVVAAAAAGRPAADLTTPDGNRHRLWVLDQASAVASVADAMRHRRVLIADGHHRYAAYRALQQRRHAAGHGPGPWDRGLALLVDSARYPLDLSAIHRSVAGLQLDPALAALQGLFHGIRVDGRDPGELELLRAGAARPAFVLVEGNAGGSRAALVHVADADAVQRRVAAALPSGRSRTYRMLDATVLHTLVLDELWKVDDAAVTYHHDVTGVLGAARRGHGIAVLLQPALLSEVLAIAGAGETMPRKSTSFGPKPRTGLVLRSLDAG